MNKFPALRALIALLALAGTLSLHAAGLSGTVSRASDGAPLSGVVVTASRVMIPFGGLIPTSMQTDALGQYQFQNLPAGFYYVDANAIGTDLVRQLHPSGYCPPESCDAWVGHPGVTRYDLADAQQLTGIDFAIAQGGSVSGVVRRADTQAVLVDRTVTVLPVGWSRQTDVAGTFAFSRVPVGTLRLRADGSGPLVSTLHPDVACELQGCASDSSPATAVVLNAGASLSALDISMPVGARIGGLLEPIATTANRQVRFEFLHTPSGATGTRQTQVAADGTYLIEGLALGSYQLSVMSNLFRAQVFPSVLCVDSCLDELALGTAVVTALGQTAGDIDFVLTSNPRIEGVVSDALTSQPLPGVEVVAYIWTFSPFGGPGPLPLATDLSAADGSYRLEGINPQAVKIATRNALGYRDERYDNQLCANSGCLVNEGSDWPLNWGDVMMAHFALQPGGSIFGRVRFPLLAGAARPSIEIFDLSGVLVTSVYAASDGAFQTTGLAPGSYRLRAIMHAAQGLGQVYGGMSCSALPSPPCEIGTGQIIELTSAAVEININIDPMFVSSFE